jgi:PEP-CTERM motif
VVFAWALFLFVPGAFADSFTIPGPNIIGFANATSCGAANPCDNGEAYNLSQSSWLSTPASAQSYANGDPGPVITSLTFTVTGSQAKNSPTTDAPNLITLPVIFTWTSGNGFPARANFDQRQAPWVHKFRSRVPEPSTSLLLASGLLGFLGLRRLWTKTKTELPGSARQPPSFAAFSPS